MLVEATSNQVNQFGGYTGQTAAQFRDALWRLADEVGLARERVWLGGDHLGPNAWQDRPAQEAMALAETLIDDYVRAGFRKIHLDCSMSCAGDPRPWGCGGRRACGTPVRGGGTRLGAERRRSAGLCDRHRGAGAGRRAGGIGGPAGHHAAGGGANAGNAPYRLAKAELNDAWQRTIALVVQPGVEFDHHSVERYQPQRADALSHFIERQPGMIYEAHSTDYQPPQAYRQLVRDHFAILKVGPALTFALREALFALDRIEREWLGNASRRSCAPRWNR